MSQHGEKTLRQHIVAAGRDIVVISAVLGILFSAAGYVFAPRWKPYKDLPDDVHALKVALGHVQTSLAEGSRPRVVDTQGNGQIVGPELLEAGQPLTLVYSLRRNISCDGLYKQNYFNVDTGTTFYGGVVEAQKAPTTKIYLPFKISIYLPEFIPPGRYIYTPEMVPKECGVYGTQTIAPSQIFTVEKTGNR